MNKNVDVLIVGQGIAGTCLAYNLYKRDISFAIINDTSYKSSSMVASGLINPITGRNFVKSWMIDELLPVAHEFYNGVSELIDQQILNDKRIIRNLKNANEENQWYGRSKTAGYEKYINETYSGRDYSQFLSGIFSLGLISKGTNIRSKALLTGFKDFLLSMDCYKEASFDYDKLIVGQQIQYEEINADKIVFAEGYGVRNNPYFRHLEFRPAKGEVLLCRIPDLPTDYILKHQKFLVPLEDDIFWVGSTYQWEFQDMKPTLEKRAELESFLIKYLKLPYQIVDHVTAVRPTTKDRRPFIGQHASHKNMYIINGLGTKGFSLAPYWSQYLTQLMFDQLSPHPDLPTIR